MRIIENKTICILSPSQIELNTCLGYGDEPVVISCEFQFAMKWSHLIDGGFRLIPYGSMRSRDVAVEQ